jgi:hypothetical protein
MKNVSQTLVSLASTKLAIQAATSIGYDSQALGLMAVAVALIGVNVALVRDLGPLWWLPIFGLGASLLMSTAAISQPGLDTGQSVTQALRINATYEQTDGLVLADIAQAIDDNLRPLEAKRGLVTRATILIGLSFVLVGISQLLPSCWETFKELAG